jgi:hypothetical protein
MFGYTRLCAIKSPTAHPHYDAVPVTAMVEFGMQSHYRLFSGR